MKDEKEVKTKQKKKLTLKERWKDKRERAKLELMLYGIFFLVIIIFARISNSMSIPSDISSDNNYNNSFISEITDNYQYDIDINIDNNNYKYYGKRLGHNKTITKVTNDTTEYYYQTNDKYYILDARSDKLILTSQNNIYSNIDYRYLDINNIKEYIELGSKKDNIYSVKLSDIILNNNSDDVITIEVDEENKTITIDYTNLFKIDDENLVHEEVIIKYSNIGSINSLEE